KGVRKIFLAGIVGAMQMLAGGPETIFLTWLLLAALWVRHFIKGDSARVPTFRRFPTVVLLVIALSAIQLLPFLDLVAHSQREAGYADLRWSMPASGWANFLVPMAFGSTQAMGVFFQNGQSWTSSYYLGIGGLLLALLAIGNWRQPRVPLLAIAAIGALIFALGENTFIYPTLRKIFPALSFITYPIKYVLLLTFVAPLLGAFALLELQKKQMARRIVLFSLVLLALIAGILFWATRFSAATDDVHATIFNGLTRATFLLFIGILLFFLTRDTKSIAQRIIPLLLIFAVWL